MEVKKDKEQAAPKQVKEASPEECDQVVEGLSSVKAKAKAKQTEEYGVIDKSLLQKLWARLLGIGPALRAVASMSREDWAVKIRHWKGKFKSTLQHYWLDTKLLWAVARISSRLLVKVANGKSLSRRERQKLTHTTSDIFRDYDGKVTPEEVTNAAVFLKDTLGKDGIKELISYLSKDQEGRILVEDIVKIGSQINLDDAEIALVVPPED